MERLTQWIGEDEDRRAIPRPDIRSNGHGRCCNKLAEYEDAEEQGLLVRLPCKVGDTVYKVNAGAKQPIIPMIVSEIHFLCYKNERAVRFDAIGKEDIGRIVFLTREEAEKKLEEMQNDKK